MTPLRACVYHSPDRFQTSAYELNPAELRELLLDLVAASLDKGVVSQSVVQLELWSVLAMIMNII